MSEEDKDKLRGMVREAKVKFNITYKELAKQCGINYKTLRNFLAGGTIGKDKGAALGTHILGLYI